eukprot:1876290-Rhodomonas_salina.5
MSFSDRSFSGACGSYPGRGGPDHLRLCRHGSVANTPADRVSYLPTYIPTYMVSQTAPPIPPPIQPPIRARTTVGDSDTVIAVRVLTRGLLVPVYNLPIGPRPHTLLRFFVVRSTTGLQYRLHFDAICRRYLPAYATCLRCLPTGIVW